MQLIIYGQALLHILGEAIGERTTSLIAIGWAVIISLCDIYMRGNIALFTSCLVATFLSVLIFLLASLSDESPSEQGLMMSKLFVVVSRFSKSITSCSQCLPLFFVDGSTPQIIARELYGAEKQ